MYTQYKIIDVLAKKAGGPYVLSTILLKRARQVLKGKAHMLEQNKDDPIQEALEDYTQDKLEIRAGEETTPEVTENSERSE
ncbi:MAG: DNA-directed RNA polymerase subunit omega [Candidatus Brocadiales bacterium]